VLGQKPVDHGRDARLQEAKRARREGRGQKLAHARVQRRVVEHQAGRVVAIERRADAELGAELGLLVGAHAGVAIADRDVGVAREKDAAVRQALQRREAAQRMVVGERIVEKSPLERCQIEPPGEGLGFVLGQFDQATSQSWASVRANTVRPAALRGPSWASAGGRITSA